MEEKFKKLQEKYPDVPTIRIFTKMIMNKRITDFDLRKWFDILVDKSDWKGTPKEELIKWYKNYIIKQ